jgi:hypothetical protein
MRLGHMQAHIRVTNQLQGLGINTTLRAMRPAKVCR